MASQGKIIGIVAWSLVGILAIGLVLVALMGSQRAGRAAGLGEALVQVAQTAGVQDWTPAVPVPEAGEDAAPEAAAPEALPVTVPLLNDPVALAAVQERIQEAIRTMRMELASATDALTAAQGQTSTAQAEASTLSRRVEEQVAQAESLSKELAAKSEALAAAQADVAKVTEEAEAARQAADKQKARLEKTVERLKAEKAEEVARLQAEIEALQTPPEPEVEWIEEEEAEPEIEIEAGRLIGSSDMFSNIRYSENQTLQFLLLDGQTLAYEAVPPDVVDRLSSAGDTLDVTYRFRIQGMFKSLPPDGVVIRKYWKWHRRNKVRSDVRFVEPDAPVVEESEAEVEANTAESSAE